MAEEKATDRPAEKAGPAPETKPAKKKVAPEQYLLALFVCADWIPEEYRKLSGTLDKKDTEVLKELYMCACDGIPAVKAAEALNHEHAETSLRFLRMKKLEEEALQEKTGNLEALLKKTEAMEQEMARMSESVSQLAVNVPRLPELFPENKENIPQKNAQEQPQREPVPDEVEHVSESGTLPDNAGKKKIRWRDRKKSRIGNYMEQLAKEGYDSGQMNFILDCLEDGLTEEQIGRIISPNLPVAVMQRLRKIIQKDGGKTNG